MGGPYKLKKRGKPMTTIYDAAILLVDDNPDLLTLVTDNLRTAGYKSVCTAADCAAARAAFAAHRPDLMILDINLPDGDGFGLFRTQSEKLRALIEDLNLTSKLQYGAQPLRCRPTQAGPLLRRLAAEFCDSPLAARCTVALEIAPDADKAILDADAALLARAVENLLHNAACHNPGPVQVQLSAVRTGKTLRITIADDGAGYPPAVLHALQTGEAGENTPHILGLHVVEQIIRAHGGTAAFARNAPRGAKAVLVLPVTEDPAAR